MARGHSAAWRQRAAACSVATTFAVGLREALGDEARRPPIVVDHDGGPGRPERVTLFFHPEIPEASLVLVR